MAFADRLVRELKNAGHSQSDLARRIGRGQSTVCLWANGKRTPPLSMYEKLIRLYPGLAKE